MRKTYKTDYTRYSGTVKALIIRTIIRDGRRKYNMVEAVQATLQMSPQEKAALKQATGCDTLKAALQDAVDYRIKHPKARA